MWTKIYKLIVFLLRFVTAVLSQQIRHLFIHERIAEKYWHSGDKAKPCACARDCQKWFQHIMSMVYVEMLCTQKPLEKLSGAHMCAVGKTYGKLNVQDWKWDPVNDECRNEMKMKSGRYVFKIKLLKRFR